MQSIPHPSLHQINSAIVSNIIPVLLPKYDASTDKLWTLSDDMGHLFDHPNYRFADIKCVPQVKKINK